jgi:hypothetical protein
MANTLTYVIPQLLAQGLVALRQQSIMARIVNRGYEELAGDKGSTIDIPIPSAVAIGDVAPAATPPAVTSELSPTKVSIQLNLWKEASFYLTDKDMLEAMNGTIPMQASEAAKTLANQIDSDILALYKKVYGWAGTAGVTPMETDLKSYLAARKTLAQQLAPLEPRYCIIDPTAEANALGLRAFQDTSFRGDQGGIINGQIGMKLGALWAVDQNIPTHTLAAATGGTIALDFGGGYALGTKTVHMDGFTVKPAEGDVFTIAGDDQTYSVVSSTVLAGTDSDVTFEPGLKVAIPAVDGSEVVTWKDTHTVNLLFHRDAFALAMRPFMGADPMNIGNFSSMVDPISGIALRLEVTREHKRTRFAYDALYGVGCPRPELAVRFAG